MFNIKEEFNKLVSNGWLSEESAEKYSNDNYIISCMNSCTSPNSENIFNALKTVSFKDVRAVILGQDPYPNPNHAHGMAFSSLDKTTPESLKNIFRAIDSTYGSSLLENCKNDLTYWAKQGVLLLNTSLTYTKFEDDRIVEKKERDKQQQILQKSHIKAWKPFINEIIQNILTLNTHPVVMFLWGNAAHELVFRNIKNKEFQNNLHSREGVVVPNTSVMLLQTAHPSPLSVNRGGDFLITAPVHFKKADEFLGMYKIDWTKLNE